MKHDCVYFGRDLVHVPVAYEREAKDCALALARECVHALEEALPEVREQRAVDLRAPPPRDETLVEVRNSVRMKQDVSTGLNGSKCSKATWRSRKASARASENGIARPGPSGVGGGVYCSWRERGGAKVRGRVPP